MIPDTALQQHLVVLGKTGSGKSFTTRSMVERLLDLGRRVCILDYTGVWWGLRSSSDGAGDGYPVVIFGGEHADVPITERQAAEVARFVAEGATPTIIDLDGMTVGAQHRFVTTFCEELYRANSAPLHLVIEEIDELAPQTGAPGAERMIGAVCRIFQRGRSKGFRAIAITQRPANVHKRVLAQCNAMIALRLVAPQDRKAIADWIRGHGDDAAGKRVIDSLPKLARGEGWIWAPEQDVLERTKFPAIKTFDSMRAPEDGESVRAVRRAQIDMAAIRSRFAAVAESAGNKAEGGTRLGEAELSRLQKEAWSDGRAVGYQEAIDRFRAAFMSVRMKLAESLAVIDAGLADAETIAKAGAGSALRGEPGPPTVEIAVTARPAARQHTASTPGDLDSAAKKLLAALARWNNATSWANVCIIAGLVPGNGYFYKGKKLLLDGGFVGEMPEGAMLTEKGIKAAGKIDARPTRWDLAAIWSAKLKEPAPRILSHLMKTRSGAATVEEIAEATALKPGNGYWYGGLSALRDAGLIEQSGSKAPIKLTEMLRP